MSKCKGGNDPGIAHLVAKGVRVEDVIERFVVIKIPYELLKTDPDTQKVFQGIVRISTEADEQRKA